MTVHRTLAVCAALLQGPALADQLPLWEAGAGLVAMRLPDYRGSDESRNWLLPLPWFVYRGEALRVDRRGAAGVLWESDRLEFDISGNATNPAASDRNRAREGMPNLGATIEVGPRLRWRWFESADRNRALAFELPVRTVIALDFPRAHRIGWVVNPLVNFDWRHVGGSRWNVSAQAGPLWADGDYHRYYYTVRDDFARADRPAYQARGGYSGTQATFTLSRRFDRFWLGAFVRAHTLRGAVFEDSPLVRSSTAVMAGVAMAWVFAESGKRVEAEE